MSYTINVSFGEKYEGEDFYNLSWNEFDSKDENLIGTEQFDYFYDDYKDEFDAEYETEEEHKLGLVDKFRETQAYDELRDTFHPMMNYVHILQQEPLQEQIALVEKYAGVCVVLEFEDMDMYGLALTGGGMDLSDYLELAYYVTDGVSPIEAREVLSLGGEAKKLLEFCRSKAKETGSVCLWDIKNYFGEKDA